MSDVRYYRNKVERLKAKKSLIEKAFSDFETKYKKKKRESKNCEEALLIAQKVCKETQAELEYKISEIVTLALETVFEEPYEFKLEFDISRNKVVANMWLESDGERFDPTSDVGGGVVDITSFALRIALWNLNNINRNNTIILDEPFKFVDKDRQPKAAEMLKLLSEELGIQFIMTTHNKELMEIADKTFEVVKRGKISKIKEVKN